MNLCKWSHEKDKRGIRAARDIIDQFIKKSTTSKLNFILKEIELLDPHLIISMNLGEELFERFANASEESCNNCNNGRKIYCFTQDKKKHVVFDSWHFSAPKKAEELDIYKPLLEMTRQRNPHLILHTCQHLIRKSALKL